MKPSLTPEEVEAALGARYFDITDDGYKGEFSPTLAILRLRSKADLTSPKYWNAKGYFKKNALSQFAKSEYEHIEKKIVEHFGFTDIFEYRGQMFFNTDPFQEHRS